MSQPPWDFKPFDELGQDPLSELLFQQGQNLPKGPSKVPIKQKPKLGPSIGDARARGRPLGLLANRRDEGVPRSFLLQKWITIRATSPIVSVVQQDSGWRDNATYADAVFWVEVAEVTNPGGGATVSLVIESSPTWDEANFKPVAPPLVLVPSSVPYIIRCVRTPSTVPLSRWTRWRLRSSTSGTWDATIRIRGTCGFSSFILPTSIRDCWCWLRADLGVTSSGGNVTFWGDQSVHDGTPNDPTNDAYGTVSPPTFNANPINGQPTISFNPSLGQYMQLSLSTMQVPNKPVVMHAFVVNRRAAATETVASRTGFWMNAATDAAKIPDIQANGGQIIDDAFSNAIHTCGTPVVALDTPHVYEVVSDVSSWANLINGRAQFSTSHSFLFNGQGDIGGTSLGGRFYPGDWAEIVLYTRILKGAERALLIDYFNGRYGLGAV